MISSKITVDERRKDPRVDNNIPVKIVHDDRGDVVTETKNVSRSGAYCRVNTYIAPMTKLKICLLLPLKQSGKVSTRKVVCEGVVIRVDPEVPVNGDDYHVAIFFNDITQANAKLITDYVETFL